MKQFLLKMYTAFVPAKIRAAIASTGKTFAEIWAKIRTRDVWVRTMKTFWQSATGIFTTSFPALWALSGDAFGSALISLLGTAISAGVCAVWNGVISPLIFPPTTEGTEDEGNG